MRKRLKSFVYILLALLAASSVVGVLFANKAENRRLAEMAGITASALPVKVDTLEFSSNTAHIKGSGILENEIDLMLKAESQGRIIQILKQKGDWIQKGDIILKLDTEILKAKQSLSKVNLDAAKRDYERMQRLVNQEAVTQKQLEDTQVKLTKANADYVSISKSLDNAIIKAPVDGYITDSYVEEGMLISSNLNICNIISPQKLKLQMALSIADINLLSLGDTVIIKSTVSTKQSSGIISNLSQKALSNNNFLTEIKLDESDLFKAGMHVHAHIYKPLKESIKVPRIAVEGTLKDASVYLAENNKAQKTQVEISEALGDSVIISGGLKENQIIVKSGIINLYDQANIKIIN